MSWQEMGEICNVLTYWCPSKVSSATCLMISLDLPKNNCVAVSKDSLVVELTFIWATPIALTGTPLWELTPDETISRVKVLRVRYSAIWRPHPQTQARPPQTVWGRSPVHIPETTRTSLGPQVWKLPICCCCCLQNFEEKKSKMKGLVRSLSRSTNL